MMEPFRLHNDILSQIKFEKEVKEKNERGRQTFLRNLAWMAELEKQEICVYPRLKLNGAIDLESKS